MADTNFTSGTIVASSWLDDVNTNTYAILAAVAGTNTITAVGASTVVTAYPRGIAFRFIPQNSNTGPVTINISGLGAKAITKMGTVPLRANDLLASAWAYIAYDGTQFQLINPMTNAVGQLIGVQTFGSTSVYTHTTGTNSIVVELLGPGGGGGGAGTTGVGQSSLGGPGGAGGYCRSRILAGFSGATVTIGSGGSPGTGLAGSNGSGPSTFLTMSAGAGLGGGLIAGTAGSTVSGGGGGGAAAGGNLLNTSGQSAEIAIVFAGGFGAADNGAASIFAAGGTSGYNANGQTGGIGAGGGGSFNGPSSGATRTGGGGGNGYCIIYEYS